MKITLRLTEAESTGGKVAIFFAAVWLVFFISGWALISFRDGLIIASVMVIVYAIRLLIGVNSGK